MKKLFATLCLFLGFTFAAFADCASYRSEQVPDAGGEDVVWVYTYCVDSDGNETLVHITTVPTNCIC